MPTYEERRAARAERLEARAEKLAEVSDAAYKAQAAILDGIPMGQPILVGHHSERGHRRDLKRADSLMRKSYEADKERQRVASIEPTSGVLASDSDAVEVLKRKLEKAEHFHAQAKEINRLVRKKDREGIAKLGFNDAQIDKLFTPDFCGRLGIPDYALKNNNAEIRRLRERIKHLEQAKAAAPVDKMVGDVQWIEDPEAMRLRLLFPGRPAPATITMLKSHGFRWAPSEGAWQRQLSNAARWAAAEVLKTITAE